MDTNTNKQIRNSIEKFVKLKMFFLFVNIFILFYYIFADSFKKKSKQKNGLVCVYKMENRSLFIPRLESIQQ